MITLDGTIVRIRKFCHELKKSTPTLQEENDQAKDRLYLVSLFVLLAAFLIALEQFHPYFFLQDDNRDQYLPYFVHNYRALLKGEIALYNFHQYLGLPHLANGNSAALYPLSWFSVFLSQVIFGHYFAAIDIVVCFHLVIGALGFYKLMRLFDLDQTSAFFGAITWPLASYFIYIGNSWYVVTGPVAYLPWMIYFSIKIYKSYAKYGFIVLAALPRILLIYIGHPQFTIYALICEFLCVELLMIKSLSLKTGKFRDSMFLRGNMNYILSYILTFFLSLPLVLPMWQQTLNSNRNARLDWKTFISGSTILPMWLTGLTKPYNGHIFESISFYGYACLGFVIISLGFLLLSLFSKQPMGRKYRWPTLVLAALGVFTFLWAGSLFIARFLYRVPVLNMFRWPYKMLIQFSFFLITLSCIGFYLFFDRIKTAKRLQVPVKLQKCLMLGLIGAQVIQFGFLYFLHPVRAIRIHQESVPWEEPWAETLARGRIISVGFDITQGYTVHTLAFNYCTFWGLENFAGYEAMLLEANDRATSGTGAYSGYLDDWGNNQATLLDQLEYFRDWGVNWYIVNPAYVDRYGDLPLDVVAVEPNRVIYHDLQAKSLFYWANTLNHTNIEHQYSTNSITLAIDHPEADYLVVNYLYNDSFKAQLDGEPVPLYESGSKMIVNVPAGVHEVIITYQDQQFNLGLLIAMLTLLGVAILQFYRWTAGRPCSKKPSELKI